MRDEHLEAISLVGTLPRVHEAELVEKVRLPTFKNEYGALVPFEFGTELPFQVHRAFAIAGVPDGAYRGAHGHYTCWQCVWCLSGSVRLTVSDGDRHSVIRVSDIDDAVVVPPLHWLLLDEFGTGTVLCVLTSHPFDENDYYHGLVPPARGPNGG